MLTKNCLACSNILVKQQIKFCSTECRNKYPISDKTRLKLRSSHLGKKPSLETIRKQAAGRLGQHYQTEESKKKIAAATFKGDKVGYSGLHRWIYRKLGQPGKCEHCLKDGLSGKKIQWANRSGNYSRDLTDWIRLCASCHKIYDLSLAKVQ